MDHLLIMVVWHIFASVNYTMIRSDNGLSPHRLIDDKTTVTWTIGSNTLWNLRQDVFLSRKLIWICCLENWVDLNVLNEWHGISMVCCANNTLPTFSRCLTYTKALLCLFWNPHSSFLPLEQIKQCSDICDLSKYDYISFSNNQQINNKWHYKRLAMYIVKMMFKHHTCVYP